MKEPPLPDGRGNFYDLAEAITPPSPKTRTAVAPATDRLRVPVAMPEQEELPLPYGFTRAACWPSARRSLFRFACSGTARESL